MGKKVFSEQGVKLEPHSERFGKALFRCFPQWRQYATYYEKGELDDPVYYLKVVAPSEDSAIPYPLAVSTSPGFIFMERGSYIEEWIQLGTAEHEEKFLQSLQKLAEDRVLGCACDTKAGK